MEDRGSENAHESFGAPKRREVGGSLLVAVRHRTMLEVVVAEVESSHASVDDATVICGYDTICLGELCLD